MLFTKSTAQTLWVLRAPLPKLACWCLL